MDMVESIVNKRSDAIETCARDGATSLGLAVQGNHEAHARFLISRRAIYNRMNVAGESLLDISVQTHAHKTLGILLENSADCSLKTKAGETLLHQAAQYGNLETLTTLLLFHRRQRSIDVEARVTGFIVHQSSDRFNGFTALQIAEQRKHVTTEWLDLFRTLIHRVENLERGPFTGEIIEEEDTEEFEDALEHQG